MQCGYSLDVEFISTPTRSPNRNLSKNIGIYVKNTKKNSFFMILIPKFILKNCLRPIQYFNIKAILLANTYAMEFELGPKGPF